MVNLYTIYLLLYSFGILSGRNIYVKHNIFFLSYNILGCPKRGYLTCKLLETISILHNSLYNYINIGTQYNSKIFVTSQHN